ncbi:MAG: ethanolamine ammonia-lyase reactivating factor EutA [Ruminococcus sp.]|jgi:ethanolamine utilization protein EutA
MKETIVSVGIDIGTSTTQLVFSRLTMENQASGYGVPRIAIIDKEVIYRSDIYITPLLSREKIDMQKIKQIIEREYKKADISEEQVQTGAVIITGETARKENAKEVLKALSHLAGDFVVATAGPDLESVLAGKGAGADRISRETRSAVVNVDIGGGTSNLALFDRGKLAGTSCIDVGGRLIKVEKDMITYIYPPLQKMAADQGMDIREGERVQKEKLWKICQWMADHLAQALHLKPKEKGHEGFYTNGGKPLPDVPVIEGITVSGGVAGCMEEETEDVFCYGDIGVLLGRAVRENKELSALKKYQASETIRATVVGAGNHTTEVSGSTISYEVQSLPLRNLPVVRISREDGASAESLRKALETQLSLYCAEGKEETVAISFGGEGYDSFQQIQELADAIAKSTEGRITKEHPLVVVVEKDIAKALGQALRLRLIEKKEIICIDGIAAKSGDYLDIGKPLAQGRVVPVVIKTLIFNT